MSFSGEIKYLLVVLFKILAVQGHLSVLDKHVVLEGETFTITCDHLRVDAPALNLTFDLMVAAVLDEKKGTVEQLVSMPTDGPQPTIAFPQGRRWNYTCVKSPHHPSVTITVHDAMMQDSGSYVCALSIKGLNVTSRSFNRVEVLSVNKGPAVEPTLTEVMEASLTETPLEGQGKPDPMPRKGRQTGEGPAESTPPSLFILLHLEDGSVVTKDQGELFIARCMAVCRPTCTTSWSFNPPLGGNGSFERIDKLLVAHMLNLNSMKSDAGAYRCTGTNEAETLSSTIELKVVVPQKKTDDKNNASRFSFHDIYLLFIAELILFV
ncbi:unnamed protein product [Lymnaea stagnalis]|uniref:Ig-like domain-containing protein n=1 Tax=Lymnaea stagnalis TaxID=6523 RepID=A0AAV2I9A3_LYMST